MLVDAIDALNDGKPKYDAEIDLTDWLEDIDTDSYFHYEGSLTTPGCNEVVQWVVFKDIIHVRQDQVSYIK